MKLNKTNFQIQFKRGLVASINTDLTKYFAATGEPHYATDTKDIYIYDGSANVLVGGVTALDAKVDVAGDTMTGSLKTAGRKKTIAVKTTTYTVLETDDVIVCNSTTAFTVTLPAATGSGQTYSISNINTGVINLKGDGTETINGELNQTIDQWASISVVDYASGKWTII